jgi:gallate dioxygenase
MITRDPSRLAEMTHAEYASLGGLEGAEIIMWLIMRGALSANVRKVHSSYYLPSMTGIGTLVLENESAEVPGKVHERHRQRMGEQLAGADGLTGTYPFTLAASLKAYRLNKFLHNMIVPSHRELFLKDADALFTQAALTDEEKDLVRRRDWRGLIHYGVIFFMLEKLAATVGVSNLHVYAAMRGESLEDFLKTRNTRLQYSVTGVEAAQSVPWDTPALIDS